MIHNIPKKLHFVFNTYITDEEITEWLNDCIPEFGTWDIDYDTMKLEIRDATQAYNIKEFWTEVAEFFENDLEAAE